MEILKSKDMEKLYQSTPDPWHNENDSGEHFLKTYECIFKHLTEKCIDILDLGCAEGYSYISLLAMCANRSVTMNYFGVDISETAITNFRKMCEESKFDNVRFFIEDMEKSEVVSQLIQQSNLTIAIESIYYLNHPSDILRKWVIYSQTGSTLLIGHSCPMPSVRGYLERTYPNKVQVLERFSFPTYSDEHGNRRRYVKLYKKI